MKRVLAAVIFIFIAGCSSTPDMKKSDSAAIAGSGSFIYGHIYWGEMASEAVRSITIRSLKGGTAAEDITIPVKGNCFFMAGIAPGFYGITGFDNGYRKFKLQYISGLFEIAGGKDFYAGAYSVKWEGDGAPWYQYGSAYIKVNRALKESAVIEMVLKKAEGDGAWKTGLGKKLLLLKTGETARGNIPSAMDQGL